MVIITHVQSTRTYPLTDTFDYTHTFAVHYYDISIAAAYYLTVTYTILCLLYIHSFAKLSVIRGRFFLHFTTRLSGVLLSYGFGSSVNAGI